MPQQAVAKGIGQTLERRAQFMTRWSCVVRTLSTGSAVSMPMGGRGGSVRCACNVDHEPLVRVVEDDAAAPVGKGISVRDEAVAA
jgi:hypothetical protein